MKTFGLNATGLRRIAGCAAVGGVCGFASPAAADVPETSPPAAAPSAATEPSAAAAPPVQAPPPVAPAPAQPPPPASSFPAIERMVGTWVILSLTDGKRLKGRLVTVDQTTAVVKTDGGTFGVPRVLIANAMRDPDGEELEEADSTPGMPTMRGTWMSAEITLAGVQHAWSGRGDTDTLPYVGAVGSPFNIGVGAQLSRDFLLGARFGLQLAVPEGDDAVFAGKAAVRLEFLYGSGRSRGFVAFEPGLATVQVSRRDALGAFNAALSLGAHLFAAKSFSIDPYAEVSYQQVFDEDFFAVTVRGGLMFSGWIWQSE